MIKKNLHGDRDSSSIEVLSNKNGTIVMHHASGLPTYRLNLLPALNQQFSRNFTNKAINFLLIVITS